MYKINLTSQDTAWENIHKLADPTVQFCSLEKCLYFGNLRDRSLFRVSGAEILELDKNKCPP